MEIEKEGFAEGFVGLWLPIKLLETKGLNWSEKGLIAFIHALGKTKNGCYVSSERLGEYCDLSRGRIDNMLSDLKKRGFIDVWHAKNGRRFMKANITVSIGRTSQIREKNDSTSRKSEVDFTNTGTYSNKESIEKDNKGVPPYSEGFLKFLNFWNTFFDDKELEFKPSKHDPVKPTQVLADSYLFYRELKNGIFVSNHPAVKDMLFKMGIDKKLFSRKLTDDEMLQCLENCVLQYLPNYWPESVSDKKKILPKSLSTTILNARNLSCPSVFLKLLYRPPTPIAQGIKLPANLQPAASYAIRALNESGIYNHDLTDADQNKIKKAIVEIAAKREDYIDRVGQVYKQDKRGNYFEAVVGYDPDDEKEICGFVKHYCAFLETEHERLADFFEEKGIKGSTVPVNQIAPSGQKSKWHGFLQYCDDEFKGLELEPSDDRLAGIEREVEQGIRESKQMEEREYHNAVKYFEGLKKETEDERAARLMDIEFDKESYDNMIRRYKQAIIKHKKAM